MRAIFVLVFFFFFQAEDGIRDLTVTGVQTCALPISPLVRSHLIRRGSSFFFFEAGRMVLRVRTVYLSVLSVRSKPSPFSRDSDPGHRVGLTWRGSASLPSGTGIGLGERAPGFLGLLFAAFTSSVAGSKNQQLFRKNFPEPVRRLEFQTGAPVQNCRFKTPPR